jgi:hypothetical protein
MAFLTTNPSPFLVNVPEFQNVVTSATGSTTSGLSNTVNDLLTYVNTTNSAISINTIGSQTNGSITFTSDINLSNAIITFLGSNLLGSNAINGVANYLAFQVSGVERARLTANGFGIGTTAPSARLDVAGSALIASTLGVRNPATLAALDVSGGAIIRGALYVSSFGLVSPALGDIYADGDITANGFFYPSDPLLKTNIRPYVPIGLPDPVEFTWRSNGHRDIGVLATQMELLEPACVSRAPAGHLTVDYSKLCVLLLAEVHTLKTQVSTLNARIS